MKVKAPGRVDTVFAQKHLATGELRQDLLTGEWVVVAPDRADKPDDFTGKKKRPALLVKYKEDCPFCNLVAFPQRPDVLRLPDDPDEWHLHVFPNKYPAFRPKDEFRSWQAGPYRVLEAVGYHEILAPRWHDQTDANLDVAELALQLEALVLRYRQLREKPSVNYIQIIKNHGEDAGASLEHPHYQIFTLPVLPRDIRNLLRGAQRFAAKRGRAPFEVMLEFERESEARIVCENDFFTAFCPFVSRVNFEVWIMPRQPEPYFENLGPEQREQLAEVLHDVLARLSRGLADPSYNYFIHSAPCDDTGFVCERAAFESWRWHIEIFPRTGSWGGLELGSGLEVITKTPESAAAFLREQTAQPVAV
jgi:UDPglucose--hexose-1-phosphate uridylyltransferase